jgi:ABC-2 type transport system ATP-binding protein
MKQKLGIACALVHDPQVLFMDEPTANLDPQSAKTVRDFLDLKKEKRTIFLNTHNLDEAQRICDRIAILNTKLMAVGTPEELERSASGRKTIVRLVQVTEAILAAISKLPLRNASSGLLPACLEVLSPFNGRFRSRAGGRPYGIRTLWEAVTIESRNNFFRFCGEESPLLVA